jgi:hypothetical protein
MLDTEYNIDIGGIFSPIKQLFDTASKELGITLTKHISENQQNLLKRKTSAKDMTILHIDSSCLTYTPTFTTQLTVHSNHYVNVFDLNRNKYLISDSYIPTIPPSAYQGWIEIDDDYISKSVIFTLDPEIKKSHTEEKRSGYIHESLKSYFNDEEKGNNNFDKLAKEIESIVNGEKDVHVSTHMLEMAACIVVSGLYASRMLFLETFKNSSMSDTKKELAKQIVEIGSMYMSLKLLFTKCSFSNRSLDYVAAINKIYDIKKLERSVFHRLLV